MPGLSCLDGDSHGANALYLAELHERYREDQSEVVHMSANAPAVGLEAVRTSAASQQGIDCEFIVDVIDYRGGRKLCSAPQESGLRVRCKDTSGRLRLERRANCTTADSSHVTSDA